MEKMIAIVGRPNVGKSTLFNYVTQTRDALVEDWPGVTRDRQVGVAKIGDEPFWIVDTSGLSEPDNPDMADLTDKQVLAALKDADRVLFLVDSHDGLTSADRSIATMLRQDYADKVTLVVNKIDRDNEDMALAEFYELGFAEVFGVAAQTGRGVLRVINQILSTLPESPEVSYNDMPGARVAIVGRPNVGKSTLTNAMLGEERVVVFDQPGTTRDSVAIPFERRGTEYTLIDTAGVRRRTKVNERIETYSVIKTLRAMEMAQVVIVVINARDGVTDQDLRLISRVLHFGKAIVLAFNKWDGMTEEERKWFEQQSERKLKFIDYAKRHTTSAIRGRGMKSLFAAIDEAYESVHKPLSTPALTKCLLTAQESHQPPLVGNRRIKLRYAHVGRRNPLSIVIHGKQLTKLPGSYKTYLSNYFRQHFKLVALPVHIVLRNDENPYVD